MKSAQGLALAIALMAVAALPSATAVGAPEDGGIDARQCLLDVASCAQGKAPEKDPDAAKDAGEAPSVAGQFGLFLGAVGHAIVQGADAAAKTVGAAAQDLGSAVAALMAGLASAMLLLRPDGMPVPVFAGLAAGSTAVVAGGAQAGAWALWRKYAAALGGLLMPLFSRIEKDALLENERRAQIYELIKQQPGIHLSGISRELDLAWGTTLHHLRKLREQRLVMIKKNGHHKCYFLNGSGFSDKQMEAMSLLKNATLAHVAAAIEAHPDSSLKELSQSLGISSPLAAHHVKTLEKAGLVRKTRAGKEVRMAPTELVPRGFFNGVSPHACAAEGAVGFA